MSNEDSISQTQWSDYLLELYEWIQEKYKLLEMGILRSNEYLDHLDYYNNEKQRIIELMGLNAEEIEKINIKEDGNEKLKLTQETFENFFGIKLDEEKSPEISDDDFRIQTSDTQLPNEIQITVDDTPIPPIKKIWEYVSEPQKSAEFSTTYQEPVDETIQANILLIGDSAVGRTSLRRSWMGKHFIDSHLTTIGASIEKKTLSINGIKYNITLTDLGGQDFYSGLRKNFYRNIDGAIVVFDITRRETFTRIEFWISEFYREIKRLVPFIIVGNKVDNKNRTISKKEALLVADRYSKQTSPKFKVRYIETSAKSGTNVNEIFEVICKEIKSFKLQLRRGR